MIIDDGFVLKETRESDVNTAMLACQDMFRWLYQKGLLEKVSFLFLKRDTIAEDICFALDTDKLLPYKQQMLDSGVKNSLISCNEIFGPKTKSRFSGAVTLNHPMLNYRNNGGCVGRSLETASEQCLDLKTLNLIRKISEKHGTIEAVKSLWDLVDETHRLTSEINMDAEYADNDEVVLPGAAYAWFEEDGKPYVGVEYEYYIEGEQNSCAIYLMVYNSKLDDMVTDHDNFVHYEVNFADEYWETNLKEEMFHLLLKYIYQLEDEHSLRCTNM